jgi:tetratricopeptide (TPR) repeat protein
MPDKVERLCQKAQLAIAERDWEKAKQAYLMALGLRSDLADVHYGLATVYFHLHELTSAAHHFREVTRLEPLRAAAFVNLGAVLNLLNQYDDAVAALRRGIQLDGQRVEAFYNLGLVYRRKGQPDLAMTAYKEAIRLNPRMADAHLNLANLQMERGNARQAAVHYEDAVKLRPGWEKALDGLARARTILDTDEGKGSSAVHQVVVEAMARAAPPPTQPGNELDRVADPALHAALLSTLHQAATVAEETSKLLHKVVGEEVEPVIKELSTALLNSRGPRSELEACLGRFETALGRMQATHQALKQQAKKLEQIGEKFPTEK